MEQLFSLPHLLAAETKEQFNERLIRKFLDEGQGGKVRVGVSLEITADMINTMPLQDLKTHVRTKVAKALISYAGTIAGDEFAGD